MGAFGKLLLVLLMIGYTFSPIDLCPGPIDDLIVILVGIAALKVSAGYGDLEYIECDTDED